MKKLFSIISICMVLSLAFVPILTSFANAEEVEESIDYSYLTPNQYMSNILLNFNYIGTASPLDGSNKTIPQIQLDYWKTPSKASTARLLCNELSNNSSFMKSVTAWEVLTFDPSEAYEEAENEIDYYVAILLSILDVQMNDSKFIDAWNCSANKTVMSLSKSINGIIESWHDVDVQYWGDLDLSDLTDDQIDEITKAFDSASETKKLYSMLGNNLDIISLASNGLRSLKEIVETVSAYSQIAELGTVIDDVLGEIYLNCRNNSAMGLAVAKVREAFNQSINSTIVTIFEASNELVKTTFKLGVGAFWDIALTGVLGSFGAAFKYGQAIGKTISNFCFSTDAIIEQFFALNALTKFENVLITTINSIASKYMNNSSEANADKFMKSVELLFSVYDLGYDYTYDFVYTVNMSGLYNKITSSYGKNETVESYRSSISSIKNSMNFIKNSITCLEGYRWYYEIDAPSGYEKYFMITEESVVTTPPYSATKEVVYVQPMSTPEVDAGALLTYTVKNDKRIIITGCNPSAVGTLNIPKAIGGFAVREIASSAFANCTGITEVTMPSTLRTIVSNAFNGCSNLSKVTLKEGLKNIGGNAFDGTAITEITIPSTVASMNYGINNSAFASANKLKTVVFADGMETLPNSALNGNTSVTEIVIPDSVTTIDYNAFYGCTGLNEITIPDSVTTIGSNVFRGCTGLTEIIIPDSVTTIVSNAFNGCSNLSKVTLNEGLKNIGGNAFDGTAITEITIPSTVASMNYGINNSAFASANKLKTVVFADGMETLPNSALNGNTSVTEIVIPDSVRTIGSSAFYGCTGLNEITIPDSVTTIGSNVFRGCTGLTEIIIPDSVITIDSHAFNGCTGLTEIIIPDSVTTIVSNAFNGCSNLSKVTLKEGLKNIGGNAFDGTAITEITIPSTVARMNYGINNSAFASANKLKTVVFADGMETLPNSALNGNTSVTEIVIPDSVRTIGSDVFYGCTGLNEITIPDSVTTIGRSAFYGCTGLTEIIIPDSVTTIDSYAFNGCSNLSKVTLNEGLKNIGGYAFDGTAITEITIPSTVASMNYGINNSAFASANKLKTVVFADGMETLPNSALNGNTSVTEIVIPDSVMTIDSYAFNGCTGLNEITIPDSVTTIDSYAFNGCTGLTEIIIPDSVTTIVSYAFNGCSNLSKVTLNEGLKNIGGNAFNGTAITEITIPSTVARMNYGINNSAFASANKLKTVVFADGMETLPNSALYGNTSVTEIVIPDSVTTIGSAAFYGCTGLTDVYYAQTEKSWSYVTINSNNTPLLNATMHYNHNAITPTYKVTYYVDSTVYEQYDIAKNDPVTIPDSPQKTGYTFTNWSPDVPETMPNYDLSFFAMWKINKYSVTYIVDGEEYKKYTFAYGFEVATPSAPVKEGYAFAGWNKEIPANMPAENLVFEATWVEIGINEVAYKVETYYMLPDGTYLETPDEFEVYTTVSGIKVSFTPPTVEGFEVDAESSILSATVAADGSTVLKVYYSRSEHSAHKHSYYPKAVIDPTAYKTGAILYGCYCGEQYTQSIPALGFVTTQNTAIAYGDNMIYGLQAGSDSLDAYTEIVVEGYEWDYAPGQYGFGTGTKAILKNGEETVSEYTVLIFGDVNGDGWYDSEDAFMVRLLAEGMITREHIGEAAYMAADANHDGVIDDLDADLLNGASLKLNEVDQSASGDELAEQTAYIEYLSLIDQTAGFVVLPDTDDAQQPAAPGTDEEPQTDETNTAESETDNSHPGEAENKTDIEFIITNIIDFFNRIFNLIFSFIIK